MCIRWRWEVEIEGQSRRLAERPPLRRRYVSKTKEVSIVSRAVVTAPDSNLQASRLRCTHQLTIHVVDVNLDAMGRIAS